MTDTTSSNPLALCSAGAVAREAPSLSPCSSDNSHSRTQREGVGRRAQEDEAREREEDEALQLARGAVDALLEKTVSGHQHCRCYLKTYTKPTPQVPQY